jgi:hypothetical protein
MTSATVRRAFAPRTARVSLQKSSSPLPGIDEFMSQAPIDQLADQLGVDEETAAKTARAAGAVLLGGMARRPRRRQGAADSTRGSSARRCRSWRRSCWPSSPNRSAVAGKASRAAGRPRRHPGRPARRRVGRRGRTGRHRGRRRRGWRRRRPGRRTGRPAGRRQALTRRIREVPPRGAAPRLVRRAPAGLRPNCR